MIKYIAIGVTVFALSFLAMVPASMASRFLPENIAGYNYHGNLWNGSADSLRINNVDIGTVKWAIKPACFFLLKLCATIDQYHAQVSSQFEIKLRNNIELRNLRANGDAAMLTSVLKNYGITSSGSFSANVDKALIRNQRLESIDGNIQFNPLVLNGVIRISMGDVNSEFQTKADHTRINIENNNGHVDLSGFVQLFTDMRYQLDMNLRQNSKTDQSIADGMRYLGKAQPDGSIRLQQQGQLTI